MNSIAPPCLRMEFQEVSTSLVVILGFLTIPHNRDALFRDCFQFNIFEALS
jgi:hypothetical protein